MKISTFVIIASCCFSNICLSAEKSGLISDHITEAVVWIYAAKPSKIGASKVYATLYLPRNSPEKIAVTIIQHDKKKVKQLHEYVQTLNQNDLNALSRNLANFTSSIRNNTSTFNNQVEIKLGGRSRSPTYENAKSKVIEVVGNTAVVGQIFSAKDIINTLNALLKLISDIQIETASKKTSEKTDQKTASEKKSAKNKIPGKKRLLKKSKTAKKS